MVSTKKGRIVTDAGNNNVVDNCLVVRVTTFLPRVLLQHLAGLFYLHSPRTVNSDRYPAIVGRRQVIRGTKISLPFQDNVGQPQRLKCEGDGFLWQKCKTLQDCDDQFSGQILMSVWPSLVIIIHWFMNK